MRARFTAGNSGPVLVLAAVLMSACGSFSSDGAAPLSSAVSPADCSDGAIQDDGTVETGYGFVPSALGGRYVQRFARSELAGSRLTAVCVCWLKTRGDAGIDFEVVVHADTGQGPSLEPIASVSARASSVARGVEEAGRFERVALDSIELPESDLYIGVRWNPSEARFLFVCADHGDEGPVAKTYFLEEGRGGWTDVERARDPIFRGHQAILVRAVSGP